MKSMAPRSTESRSARVAAHSEDLIESVAHMWRMWRVEGVGVRVAACDPVVTLNRRYHWGPIERSIKRILLREIAAESKARTSRLGNRGACEQRR